MAEKKSSGIKFILVVCGGLFALLIVIYAFQPGQSKVTPESYRFQAMNRMRNILGGIVNYRANHKDTWPNQLEDIQEDLYSPLDGLIVNPYTHDNPGYEYVKPPEGADPATTVVMYQLRDGKRDLGLAVGYGDGRVLPYAPP